MHVMHMQDPMLFCTVNRHLCINGSQEKKRKKKEKKEKKEKHLLSSPPRYYLCVSVLRCRFDIYHSSTQARWFGAPGTRLLARIGRKKMRETCYMGKVWRVSDLLQDPSSPATLELTWVSEVRFRLEPNRGGHRMDRLLYRTTSDPINFPSERKRAKRKEKGREPRERATVVWWLSLRRR